MLHPLMIQAIHEADASRKVNNGIPYYMSCAVVASPIGEVIVSRDYTKCSLTLAKANTTWKLNGKRIKGEDLENLLKEVG